MTEKLRGPIRIGLKIITALVVLAVVVVLGLSLLGYGEVYETTKLSDYGKICGNFDNDTPRNFVGTFFPEKIEDSFSQIIYQYKAKKGDSYAYECYLEFVIDDPAAYLDFTERYIERENSTPFTYDACFREQTVSDVLHLQTPKEREAVYPIGIAQIGKILFSDEQQRIIFVAIGMYDGGGANTVELGHFFSRFKIDPWEYMQSAYASEYYQERNIPNKDMS